MRMRTIHLLKPAALLLAATCVLSGLAAESRATSSNECTGTIKRAPGEQRDSLDCSGPACCEPKLVSGISRDYLVCACDAAVEPDCCYTILWLDADGQADYPDAKGACNGSDANCDTGDCGYSYTQKQGVCE